MDPEHGMMGDYTLHVENSGPPAPGASMRYYQAQANPDSLLYSGPSDTDNSNKTISGKFYYLCQILIYLSIIIYYVAGTYFLVIDRDKGGSCADTSGRDIWIFCVLSLTALEIPVVIYLFYCFSLAWADEDPSFCLNVVMSLYLLGCVTYGASVLFYHPCDDFQQTGLYIWCYITVFMWAAASLWFMFFSLFSKA